MGVLAGCAYRPRLCVLMLATLPGKRLGPMHCYLFVFLCVHSGEFRYVL